MNKKPRGQAMVEFALVFPILFFILAISIDLFRVVWVNTTVADAARQADRQAIANEDPNDSPFSATPTGSCSGTMLTPSAGGSGCLTDNSIDSTVDWVMGSFSTSATMVESAPSSCPAPAVGATEVCIWPSETAAAGAYASCAAARTALGHDPLPGDLGGRKAEWTNPQYKGCFQVVVTVVYRYDTLVPFLGSSAPSWLKLTSASTMVAEY